MQLTSLLQNKGCLQFHRGIRGQMQSFNFEGSIRNLEPCYNGTEDECGHELFTGKQSQISKVKFKSNLKNVSPFLPYKLGFSESNAHNFLILIRRSLSILHRITFKRSRERSKNLCWPFFKVYSAAEAAWR